jgi:hypothetical protein
MAMKPLLRRHVDMATLLIQLGQPVVVNRVGRNRRRGQGRRAGRELR